MSKGITGIVGLAVTIAAAALVLVAPASAKPETAARTVSGSEALGQVSGSLEGLMAETPDTFASFLGTRRLTPGGIATWRAPVSFTGCVDQVHCGTLLLEGHFLYRFRPGTTWYDFAGPPYQPGTVGDPEAWISGTAVYRIVSGTDGLSGAEGLLVFTETVFLSEHAYRGVVRL
jgi:hypothetical protein